MNWNKFQFESLAFAAGEFKIIWLDNDPEISPEHATFKLSGSDSTIWLLTIQQGSPRIVDQFHPCESPGDYSQERISDGSPVIALTSQPTPGASNGIVSTTEMADTKLSIFPNPTQDIIRINKQCASIGVSDIHGKLIYTLHNASQISINHLNNNVYMLNLDGQIFRVIHIE